MPEVTWQVSGQNEMQCQVYGKAVLRAVIPLVFNIKTRFSGVRGRDATDPPSSLSPEYLVPPDWG